MTDALPNVGRQVGLLARLWRTELDNRLRPHGLSQARWLLLLHLADDDTGLAQLDLAVLAGVTGPTLVRQIDQLETAGFVQRREDDNDRRVKRVTPYNSGPREAGGRRPSCLRVARRHAHRFRSERNRGHDGTSGETDPPYRDPFLC